MCVKTYLKCDFLAGPFCRVKSSEFFGELLRVTSEFENVIVSCLIYISSVTGRVQSTGKKGKTVTPSNRETKEGENPIASHAD